MGLASAWARRLMGAAGASLLVPTLVLVVAAAIAIGGGGLAGLRSLGQVTAGPSLPEQAPSHARRRGLSEAELVAVEVGARSGAPARPTRRGAPTSTAPTPAPAPAPSVSAPPVSRGPVARVRRPRGRVRPPTTGPTPSPPPAGQGPSRSPNLVDVIEETARGLGRQLGPLGPVTDDILDLLLGAPPPTH